MIDVIRSLSDYSGADFIEYSALLGVIVAVGIMFLSLVGSWALWTPLNSQLGASP